MKVLYVFLACIALARADLQTRIIGGTQATIENIPYQLAVMINGDFKCGGVLVSTTAALTAAQCVNGVTVSTITARAGSAFRTSQGTLKTVSSVVIHSSYSSTTYDYDIAVLKFATAFTLGTTIGVATLPSVNEIVSAGSVAQVSGWGITTIGGTSFPGYLQVASVPVVANSVCSAAYTRINAITDRMICAGYTTGGVDVCEGDTGGPLVYAGKLIGIVSWGAACGAVGTPAVYTRVAALRPWITTNAGV